MRTPQGVIRCNRWDIVRLISAERKEEEEESDMDVPYPPEEEPAIQAHPHKPVDLQPPVPAQTQVQMKGTFTKSVRASVLLKRLNL
ncbi:UNVERIFIED_CONTAM: hypothetical protein FKN15_032909 [Acipenser sinensis]